MCIRDRGEVVIAVADDDDLVADKARHAQPAGQTQSEDDGIHALSLIHISMAKAPSSTASRKNSALIKR